MGPGRRTHARRRPRRRGRRPRAGHPAGRLPRGPVPHGRRRRRPGAAGLVVARPARGAAARRRAGEPVAAPGAAALRGPPRYRLRRGGAGLRRPRRPGRWITPAITAAYQRLHELRLGALGRVLARRAGSSAACTAWRSAACSRASRCSTASATPPRSRSSPSPICCARAGTSGAGCSTSSGAPTTWPPSGSWRCRAAGVPPPARGGAGAAPAAGVRLALGRGGLGAELDRDPQRAVVVLVAAGYPMASHAGPRRHVVLGGGVGRHHLQRVPGAGPRRPGRA